MAIFKCKMCGGELRISNGEKVCECEYCGSKQTIPSTDNEKKVNLFNRANMFRFRNEFDKAEATYENIVSEFPNEAEAYWGLCLCKYGIEYVDDPKNGLKIPTCHRTSFESIFDDSNYNLALKNADAIAKDIYCNEAANIDKLQKDILSVVNREEPYDVFICYKESDKNGERTIDSVIAQDIYDKLIEKGLRVFFSRITLENKLGTAYEPYIFAALNSAKVMLVIGTKQENYNAVWVKNEWSRFLGFMKKDNQRTLIPCYKDMNPYELPEDFRNLQGQDMGKIGAIQDLVHGVEKIIPKSSVTASQYDDYNSNSYNVSIDSLMKRVKMFLEEKSWQKADEYCERILDTDPQNAEAYVGKLMAELKISNIDALVEEDTPFDNNDNFKKAIRFGNEKLSDELNGYIKAINDRIKEKNDRIEFNQAEKLYWDLYNKYTKTNDIDELKSISNQFKEITRYPRAQRTAIECDNKWKGIVYSNARELGNCNYIPALKSACAEFRSISGYKDADEQAIKCEKKWMDVLYSQASDALENEFDQDKISFAIQGFEMLGDYKNSNDLLKKSHLMLKNCKKEEVYRIAKHYEKDDAVNSLTKAIEKYRSVIEWKDSEERIKKCQERIAEIKQIELATAKKKAENRKRLIKIIIAVSIPLVVLIMGIAIYITVIIPQANMKRTYDYATELIASNEYEMAADVMAQIYGYKDTQELIDYCHDQIFYTRYLEQTELISNGNYDEISQEDNFLGSYDERFKQETYDKAIALCTNKNYEEAKRLFDVIAEYKDSIEMSNQCIYNEALDLLSNHEFDDAANRFKGISGFSDSDEKALECYYEYGNVLFDTGQYNEAIKKYIKADDYTNSKEQISKCYLKLGDQFYEESDFLNASSMYESCKEYGGNPDKLEDCYMQIGNDKATGGFYTLAFSYYDKAGKLGAEAKEKYCNELYSDAVNYAYIGQYSDAISKFEILCKYNYKDSDLYYTCCTQMKNMYNGGIIRDTVNAITEVKNKNSDFSFAGICLNDSVITTLYNFRRINPYADVYVAWIQHSYQGEISHTTTDTLCFTYDGLSLYYGNRSGSIKQNSGSDWEMLLSNAIFGYTEELMLRYDGKYFFNYGEGPTYNNSIDYDSGKVYISLYTNDDMMIVSSNNINFYKYQYVIAMGY